MSYRSPHVRKCRTVLYSGFHALDSGWFQSVELGFLIPIFSGVPDSLSCIPDSKAQDSDSRYWIPNFLSVELGFMIPIVSRIPDSLSCMPDSKAQDSWFFCQWNLDSGFQSLVVFRIPRPRIPDSISKNFADDTRWYKDRFLKLNLLPLEYRRELKDLVLILKARASLGSISATLFS